MVQLYIQIKFERDAYMFMYYMYISATNSLQIIGLVI